MKKILIADALRSSVEAILNHPKAKDYEIQVVDNGPDTLKSIESFHPDLALIELMLPKMHGIEVLKIIRGNAKTAKIGVIITSYYTMIQNYRASISGKADYFLEKPFEGEQFFALVESFFAGTLKPEPFHEPASTDTRGRYSPVPTMSTSYIRFWGTRGSIPVSGSRYNRIGGNTCCLEVRNHDDLVIIDAGTGIRDLGIHLKDRGVKNVHLFIGHTHWDHITGFPFFAPMYSSDTTVHLYAPVGYEKDTRELFTEMLAYAFFPVRLDEMQAKFHIHQLRDGDHVQVGSLGIETHYTNHPGATLGFKIRSPTHTIGYITDNEVLLGYHGHPDAIGRNHPLLEPHLGLIQFLSDCDVLIHEAQYFSEEYEHKVGWGHSSIANATVLLKHTGCHEWIVTHHDPQHSDFDLHTKLQTHIDVLADCHLNTQVRLAFDGMTLPL